MGWTPLDRYESELRGGRKLPMVIARDTVSGVIRHLTQDEYDAATAAQTPPKPGPQIKPQATLIRKHGRLR